MPPIAVRIDKTLERHGLLEHVTQSDWPQVTSDLHGCIVLRRPGRSTSLNTRRRRRDSRAGTMRESRSCIVGKVLRHPFGRSCPSMGRTLRVNSVWSGA